MKNKLAFFAILSLSMIFAACSSDSDPAIVKEEMTSPVEEGATLVEETDKKDTEETQMTIEFMLEEEQLTINLNKIPILKNYLAQISDRKKEIEQMEINKLDIQSTESIYLLGFAKANDLYSYLLLDPTDEGHSFLLTDRAKFIEVLPSPDKNKLMFYFERTVNDKPWNLNKIMVLDLQSWGNKKLTYQEEVIDVDLSQFNTPISSVDWIDDTTIQASIPNVEQPTEQELTNWFNTGQPIKQVELSINNK
ncbi:hypothetical protein [Paraliobacillus salinarum]|uniref:hypothetical protein n=1 Tax=Paraliobacillus salinarum TaxID=1158996 RepID=UPI0015F568C7|nr:hypothetical protein [Paraliobacillus salinarum]